MAEFLSIYDSLDPLQGSTERNFLRVTKKHPPGGATERIFFRATKNTPAGKISPRRRNPPRLKNPQIPLPLLNEIWATLDQFVFVYRIIRIFVIFEQNKIPRG